MGKYGIPYMGSKSRIADALMTALPAGKRFVDLFGGGFAMSECALLSGKYETVLYNDAEPLVVQLVKDAIAGKYNHDQFKPAWVSREEFHERKNTDGYVRYIWSFGNDGKTYLFGKDKEEIKRKGHEYAVNGVAFDGFPVVGETIHERRLALKHLARERRVTDKRHDLEQLQQLERLEKLERLQLLQQLERLDISCMDYRDYEYRDGDVVYCDIPYQNAERYHIPFDHEEFCEWVCTRPFKVYFSSFELDDPRFRRVWTKPKISLMQAGANNKFVNECLYEKR